MSCKLCTFTCFFENNAGVDTVNQWISLLEKGEGNKLDEILKQHGHKPVFKDTEETSIEYVQVNDGCVEFQSQLEVSEKDLRPFIQLIAERGAQFIIVDIYDDQVDEGKTYYYQDGQKTTQKNIKAQLTSLPQDLRFVLAASLTPDKLPKYIAELGGYNAKVYGKPILFYMAAQPHVFGNLIEELFDKANLHATDESSGDNVIHHICRRESLDSDLLTRLIKIGVTPTAINKRGEKPIHVGIKTLGYGVHSDRSEILIKQGGESPNTLFPDGMPFLYVYLKEYGVSDFFLTMHKLGGDINYQSPEGTAAWIARKFHPNGLAKLIALNAKSVAGTHTYTNEPLVDIKTAIAFMDKESFDKNLSNLESLADGKKILELFYLCLKYGYSYGFSMLEEVFSLRVTTGEIPYPHYQSYDEKIAYNYCNEFCSDRRNVNDYFSVTRRLIHNSSTSELEKVLNRFNWHWLFYKHEEEFLGQLELLKGKGVELSQLDLRQFPNMKQEHFQGKRIHKKYNYLLRKLIDLNVDLSSVMYGYEEESLFTDENRDILDTLMRRGQSRIIRKYIWDNYRNNNKALLDFLLSTDLANISVQALIWNTLLSSIFLYKTTQETIYCDFSSDFLESLIAAGLPLNNAYKACSSPNFWTPYLNSGYTTAPPGYKEFLEVKGITKELSNAALEAAKLNPPRNNI